MKDGVSTWKRVSIFYSLKFVIVTEQLALLQVIYSDEKHRIITIELH